MGRCRRTQSFIDDLEGLPPQIKKKVERLFPLFQDNPFYPSFRTSRLDQETWYGRIDDNYRFTFKWEGVLLQKVWVNCENSNQGGFPGQACLIFSMK